MFHVARKKTEATNSFAAPPAIDRIPWVYHARGLALLLIVYRHIVLGIQFHQVEMSPFLYNFQLFFSNFRMPAFFLLSGVFLMKSLRRKTETELAEVKVKNLLYPYILWASIMLITQIVFSQFSNAKRDWSDFMHIITQPRAIDHLWYLLALFNTSILFLILHKYLANRKAVHIAIAVLLHIISSWVKGNSFFSDFFYFYIFLFAGSLLSELLINKETRGRILSLNYFKWLLPLFLIGQWFWFTHIKEGGFYEVVFFAISLIGCYFLFMVAVFIAQSRRNDWLAYIGRHSLYIYILHVPIAAAIRKLIWNAFPEADLWILFGICFLCAIVFPILLVKIFKNYGIERLFTLQKSIAA